MFWLTLILVLLHLTRGNSPCFGRSLGISPCRTQFFKRESLTLYCGAEERIMTNSKSVTCSQKSHECNITLAGEHNSGSYWCDSNSGERGEAVNITVTAGSVILESPVHPVPEGSPVTLRCLMSHKSSKKLVVVTRINQSCTFSRDGRLIGVGLTGEMSFAAVNRSHEGLYTCTFSGVESPGSWLAVRATSSTEPLPPTNHHLLLPLVYAGPPLLLMVLLGIVGGCCWRRSRKEAEEAASEDEVHADVVQNKTEKKERDRSDCETTCSYGESLQPQPIRIPDPALYSLLGSNRSLQSVADRKCEQL
ncbi:low affinity immunoglobulin gamma Fc region receptor II-b-like isoform X2 [Gadus morhua]|uniref:low affinity immunoglobulin gamma Fc region receptor II-b-like isoform X2 n=1 Tax=Gadus morhua TaxID=8049 RepID=UPI0011B44517|nr:low affinity immunoglobulin gamma Fc region receptor II-b-like isoform X2 [Gadus morhua]